MNVRTLFMTVVALVGVLSVVRATEISSDSYLNKAVSLDGHYVLEKSFCENTGRVLQLGGPFIDIKMEIDVNGNKMRQVATAKSKGFSPFTVECTIINEGTFTLLSESEIKNFMKGVSCKCSNSLFERTVCSKKMGELPLGITHISQRGGMLSLRSELDNRKSSCEKKMAPTYVYKRQ